MRINMKKLTALLVILAMMICYVPTVTATQESLDAASAGDFEYTIITPAGGSEYAKLTKYTGSQTSVTLPASFGGAPLKVIGYEAFCNNGNITSVSIPEGIETIENRAFCGCSALDNVILPDTLKEIGDYAFTDCYHKEKTVDLVSGIVSVVNETGLAHIHFSSSLEKIGDSAFSGCELLLGNTTVPSKISGAPDEAALILPETVKEIGAEAFASCRSLVNVTIPEGVKEIKTGTFTDCSGLKKVEIPSTVTYIGIAFNGAFEYHGNFSEYEPELWIRAPHCIIEKSPDMCETVTVYGAPHSSVQAFVDSVNKDREDASLFNDLGELIELTPDINYMKFVEIEVPDHVFVGTETVPTCTERGYTTYMCQQCLEAGYYDDPELAALYVPHECDYTLPLGHSYGDWVETAAPSCETIGAKYRICVRELTDSKGRVLYKEGVALTCGHRDDRQIPALGHDFEYNCTATCTTGGREWKECSVCHIKKDMMPLLALGHEYDYAHPDEELTKLVECDGNGNGIDGVYIFACKNLCGDTKTGVVSCHPDIDGDNMCDKCAKVLTPPDLSTEQNCLCFCHAEKGIKAFIYKIQRFIWNLFRVNRICDCGAVHYNVDAK